MMYMSLLLKKLFSTRRVLVVYGPTLFCNLQYTGSGFSVRLHSLSHRFLDIMDDSFDLQLASKQTEPDCYKLTGAVRFLKGLGD